MVPVVVPWLLWLLWILLVPLVLQIPMVPQVPIIGVHRNGVDGGGRGGGYTGAHALPTFQQFARPVLCYVTSLWTSNSALCHPPNN